VILLDSDHLQPSENVPFDGGRFSFARRLYISPPRLDDVSYLRWTFLPGTPFLCPIFVRLSRASESLEEFWSFFRIDEADFFSRVGAFLSRNPPLPMTTTCEPPSKSNFLSRFLLPFHRAKGTLSDRELAFAKLAIFLFLGVRGDSFSLLPPFPRSFCRFLCNSIFPRYGAQDFS